MPLLRNGCGRCRDRQTAREEERELYCCGAFTADTMYCHHLDRHGRHLVLHGLPSSEACRCGGVIYASLGLFGTSLTCGPSRGGHDPCTPERCPFLHEGKPCPYMAAAGAEAPPRPSPSSSEKAPPSTPPRAPRRRRPAEECHRS